MRTEFELYALWTADCMCLVQTTVFILGKNIKKNETIIIFFLAVNGR